MQITNYAYMFESIEPYILKKKVSVINNNFSNISHAIEKLQAKEQPAFWINKIELPDRPLDSVFLFLQAPMNMGKYLVVYSDLNHHRNRDYDDEIKKYADLKKPYSKELPELLIFNSLNDTEKKELCERLSFKIKRFTEFLKAFSSVDEDIRPIMLYYSINYFLTFLSDLLLHFSERIPHHGLSGITSLTIQKEGAFARIVDGFFALNKPTLFSPWKLKGIHASAGLWDEMDIDDDYTRHIKAVKNLYNKYDYTQKPKISLIDLINIRVILYKHFKLTTAVSNNQISHENMILIDYLLLFIAGSIARYNPIEWRKIQSASNEEYEKIRYHINAAQTNMLNEWIPYLISEHILPLELVNKLEVS